MTKRLRLPILAVIAATAAALATGCSTVADPDQVGLYYMQGPSDGNKFGQCVEPGQTGPAEWNNSIIYLPTSLRTWNIAPDGGDTGAAVVVSTQPEQNQPSGVQVKVWSTTSFYLNTFCDKDGGVVRQFWENIGRRYGANEDAGWRSMLVQVLVPALEKATQDVVRGYTADALVGNVGGVRADAQDKISAQFTQELKRLSGGDYFCGPSFNRASKDCPEIEMIIRDVDYADPGIQDARNAKQKAIELAAAKVAEAEGNAKAQVAQAQGEVDAAAKRGTLYENKAWVQLQLAEKQLAAIQACAQTDKCTVIMGSNGNLILNQK